MNNQNYRQNFKNPAGKPGADETQQPNHRQGGLNKTSFRQNGPGYPQGNQQPYHAGPQPGSQTESTAYPNNSPSGSPPFQNRPQQGSTSRPNSSQQGNTSSQNSPQQGNASYANPNGTQQGIPPYPNGPQQGTPPYPNGSQQGTPPHQNGSQQGTPPYQNGPQQGIPPYQSGPQAYGQYQQNAQQQGNTQQQSNSQDNWMNNPNLKGMDPEKLKMLNNIANQGSQKGMNELMPFLMSAVSQNKSQPGGLDFSRQEMDTIIEVLKMGKSPEEVSRINRMMQIVKMMH